MTIKVHYPGFFTTLQDGGRYGYQRFGVPESGPMDRFAFSAANYLVGNDWETTALEIGIDGPLLEFGMDCLIALCGAGFELLINEQPMPLWTSIFIRQGSLLQVRKKGSGSWVYLAVSSGIKIEPVLGSSATYLKGKFGGFEGRSLQANQVLYCGSQAYSYVGLAGSEIPEKARPLYAENPQLEVIPGPQDDCFTQAGLETFLGSEYKLSPTSDRMGYRLEGPEIEHTQGADILSDGMLFGSVQVPASGQPIVMMSEHPTTGGYTKIASVVSADLPILAQCTAGVSRIRFKTTTLENAQERYCTLLSGLRTGVEDSEEKQLDVPDSLFDRLAV